ncbi:transposase [Streptomyces sp. WZ.A104]|nr:transposase [Streptomyces sp. WZ.A104]
MPKPYPREYREDVVRVARNREPGVTLEQIAAVFGVHPITLPKWLRARTPTRAPGPQWRPAAGAGGRSPREGCGVSVAGPRTE